MSLDRSMGEGVIGVEFLCEHCNEYIDLDYSYHEHAWRGTCWQCLIAYVADIEIFIRICTFYLANLIIF